MKRVAIAIDLVLGWEGAKGLVSCEGVKLCRNLGEVGICWKEIGVEWNGMKGLCSERKMTMCGFVEGDNKMEMFVFNLCASLIFSWCLILFYNFAWLSIKKIIF